MIKYLIKLLFILESVSHTIYSNKLQKINQVSNFLKMHALNTVKRQ